VTTESLPDDRRDEALTGGVPDQRRGVAESLDHAARAQALRNDGQAELAREEAVRALAVMASAVPPQVVRAEDWLSLGDAIVEALPRCCDDIVQSVTAMTRHLAPAQRRETQVRLARLKARSLYAAGDLAGALALRETTTVSLDPCETGQDDFFEYDVPWLIEAGRIDEAGRVVTEYLYLFANSNSRWDILRPLIRARLADGSDQSAWWPICVMRICAYGGMLFEDAFGDPSVLPVLSPTHARVFAALTGQPDVAKAAPAVFAAARQLASECDPDNPWIERFSVLVERNQGLIDDVQAAVRLQDLVDGGMVDGSTLHIYLMTRLKAFGVLEAVSIAPPIVSSGGDAMRFAIWSNGGTDSVLEPEPVGMEAMLQQCEEGERAVAAAIWHTMYTATLEQGLAHMEHFFSTGEGQRFDASPGCYSLMCNALADVYCDDRRYAKSVGVHTKGLQAYVLPQHYPGMQRTVRNISVDVVAWRMLDEADHARWREIYVSASEALWHEVEQGFTGSFPNDWICNTAMQLYYLNRADEIPVWVNRLVDWQEKGAGEEPQHLSGAALYARIMCAQYLSNVPATRGFARSLVDELRPQVDVSVNARICLVAGNTYSCLAMYSDAIACFRRSLDFNPRDDADSVGDAQSAVENIADCQARMGRGKWMH